MRKIEQDKFNANLVTSRSDYKPKFTLRRFNDGLTQVGRFDVKYIEWNENINNRMHNDIKVGTSLSLDNGWLTTEITEIIENKEGYIKFQTKNSTYELTWEK